MNRPAPGHLDLCYDNDPELLPVTEARRRIGLYTPVISDQEQRPLSAALNRVLCEDVRAPRDVPGHTNSAVDGYALAGDGLPASGEAQLRVIAKAFAGNAYRGAVAPGECVNIMTGAMMPAATDTVIMREHAEIIRGEEGESIRIAAGHQPGQNVRAAGEDLRAGALALRRGTRLLPAQLGLLASMGLAQVRVTRRPRVAFFSTGDELRGIGEALAPGEVYDSNRYTLRAMLEREHVDTEDLGIVGDHPQALREALAQASARADMVITSGGVSAGEADYVKQILEERGQIGFWKIAIRPGRPLAFGRLGDTVFFGLPGNPVAVMVTFYQFVRGALGQLGGVSDSRPVPLLEATCSLPLRKKPGRTEYYRAILSRTEQGRLQVRPTGKTGSGLLHTMSDANCFIVLEADSTSLDAGTVVKVQPFFGLV